MRQKYQLLVEDKDGVWRSIDLGEDKIAWTCQTNDIAELKDRQASYSQNLKLPKTANNADVFGYAHRLDSIEDFHRKRHSCRVICAGRTIAGWGSFLVLQRVSDNFECQILGGTAHFFETLGAAEFKELDLGEWRVCRRYMHPDYWNDSYKIGYGLDFALGDYPFQKRGLEWKDGVGCKYPIVSVAYILGKIFAKHGYGFDSNIDLWEGKFLTLASVDAKPEPEDVFEAFGGIANSGEWYYNIGSGGYVTSWEIDPEKDGDGRIQAGGSYGDEGNLRLLQFASEGRIDVEIEVWTKEVVSPGVVSLTLVDRWSSVVLEKWEGVVLDGEVRSHLFRITKEQLSDTMELEVVSTAEIVAGAGFRVEIRSGLASPSNAGAKLVISERMGFGTQLDFMKVFAQAFGLTFIVDEEKKHVYAFTMDLLYENIEKDNVLDWSGKLDERGQTFDYTLDGYGQRNVVSFEDNGKDKLTDSGEFGLDNETLPKEKELVKIGVEAGEDIELSHQGRVTMSAEVPLVNPKTEKKKVAGVDEETGEEIETEVTEVRFEPASFNTIKPHLLKSAGAKEAGYDVMVHVKAQELVDDCYVGLQRMLSGARKIEVDFELTPEDIEMYDPRIPIWIEKYGGYFYLNKIRNFELGKVTGCELVKL